MGDSFGGVGISVICRVGIWLIESFRAQGLVNVLILVALILGCGTTSNVFELLGFYFFINF